MKKASLHILHDDLKKILKDVPDASTIFNLIISDAKNYPVNRSVIVTTKSKAKKIERLSPNVELFNRVLSAERTNLGHRPRAILKTDRQYLTLCSISEQADEFCRLFEIAPGEGFSIFCKLGLKKIGKNYRLNKFTTYVDYIFESYEKLLVVKTDENKELTQELFNYYIAKTKLEDNLIDIWNSYCHDFVYATELCIEKQTTPKIWVDAQFAGLKFLEISPEPYQLHGEESIKRFLTKGKKIKSDWRLQANKKRLLK